MARENDKEYRGRNKTCFCCLQSTSSGRLAVRVNFSLDNTVYIGGEHPTEERGALQRQSDYQPNSDAIETTASDRLLLGKQAAPNLLSTIDSDGKGKINKRTGGPMLIL